MKYEIKWDKRINNYFIHGSKLTFYKEDDEVHFENPYISPGSVIVQWHSEINYQGERTGLQLPLLKRGEVYHLESDMIAHPENSVAIKFKMFDRTEAPIGTQILPLKGGEVTYLNEAYSYAIELISTGVEALCFKTIWLTRKGGEA
ncbi:accessory Sec system protein Asp3 [Lactococcus petauri]|uniref:accessory Sec system protein Asp3 n=1 Tax=Lactococcus petauri TaxID=1940789 RepID=UPI003852D5A2